MKIAIVGSGISGLVSAYLLRQDHAITLFEANDYIGGHTHTVDVSDGSTTHAVDTGFIVFNDRTYPNFIKLLDRIGVASQPSDMSFSVRCSQSGLEYNPGTLGGLFAQRRNLVKPRFYRMLADIVRFYKDAPCAAQNGYAEATLGDYLASKRFSQPFIDKHIVPMGAAIWSADPEGFLAFPLQTFVQFFSNHGMLQLRDRPQWRVVRGGSSRYVETLTASFRDRIRLGTPIERVERGEDQVKLTPRGRAAEAFDAVVIATHSDQALRMLADPSPDERRILGAIPYQANETVLHSDATLLPKRKRARASWNYHIPRQARRSATLTYHMNRLQSLQAEREFCVTLNSSDEIDLHLVLDTYQYHHPVFTRESIGAQRDHDRLNGVRRTYFCGAYWGYGFHEDGVNSALAVCRHFGRSL